MQLLKKSCVLVFGLGILLTVSLVARADAVTDWNAIAVQTIVSAGPSHGSAVGFFDNATVQVAVYDAVEAFDGRFKPYHVQISGAFGCLPAAVAKAAHDVLVNRFPAQALALDLTYHNYLAELGSAEDDPGVEIGHQAAAGIIALRADDGSFPLNRRLSLAARKSESGVQRLRSSPRRLHPSRPHWHRGWPASLLSY